MRVTLDTVWTFSLNFLVWWKNVFTHHCSATAVRSHVTKPWIFFSDFKKLHFLTGHVTLRAIGLYYWFTIYNLGLFCKAPWAQGTVREISVLPVLIIFVVQLTISGRNCFYTTARVLDNIAYPVLRQKYIIRKAGRTFPIGRSFQKLRREGKPEFHIFIQRCYAHINIIFLKDSRGQGILFF